MLETGWVGGVTGDGNVNLFFLHNCYAFLNVVTAVASYFCFVTVRECNFTNNAQFAGEVVIFGLNIGKAVDSGDDVCSIFAQTVEDNMQRSFSCFVSSSCDTDCTFSSCEGFVSSQEAEAVCFLSEQHCAQVTVAKTYFTVFCNRARDAECLQTDTNCFSSFCCFGDAFFQCDCYTQSVSPNRIFKSDWLYAFYDRLNVDALRETEVSGFFQGGHTVFFQSCLNFRHSSFLSFKFSHDNFPPVPYSSRGSMYFGAFS